MSWSNVLLLHWPIELSQLRSRVPTELEIDTFAGRCWVSIIASSVSGMRPILAPPLPGLSSFLELGLRTYVRHGDESGTYHFSMDASNPAVVWLARSVFHLPYFRASMESLRRGDSIRFASRRAHQGATPADFECVWAAKGPLPRPSPGNLTHFLTERYEAFTEHRGRLFKCPFWHEGWALREARLGTFNCSVLEAAGFESPAEAPVAQHADMLAVSTWPMTELQQLEEAATLLGSALSPPTASFRLDSRPHTGARA